MTRLRRGEKQLVSCQVNGVARTGVAESRTLLSDFLRHELNAYGTHVGCEHGICGACTVILDNRLARACMIFAVQTDGAEITTVEGLSDGNLNELQQAFSRHGALQCGYCTPGILLSATHFLERTSAPTEGDVRAMLSGHLCRCTGYEGMVRAIIEVAEANAAANGDPVPDPTGDEADQR